MKIILVGFGTVGQATARLFAERSRELHRDHGLSPRLVAVFDRKGGAVCPRGLDAGEILRRKSQSGTVSDGTGTVSDGGGPSALESIRELEADVLIDATPTDLAHPAEAIERLENAFATGKHVVCVNKAPLAVAMPALAELAVYNRVIFRFSGTVGAGTPFLDWAARCAEGDRIVGVRAILNGTTNYILTRIEEGIPFDNALAEAQSKGYAERDPSMDLDGVDTAAKLVIFANAVLGRRAVLSDVETEGIRGVPAGKSFRLVGEIGDPSTGSGLRVSLQPVTRESPLGIRGAQNAVLLSLGQSGELCLSGRGAGGPETATAIVRDLVTIWHRMWERKK